MVASDRISKCRRDKHLDPHLSSKGSPLGRGRGGGEPPPSPTEWNVTQESVTVAARPSIAHSPNFTRERVTHMAELVPIISEKYDLAPRMSAEEVLAALRSIAAYTDTRSRWLAAFASPLGRVIAGRGVDLNTALTSIVGMLPPNRA
jgi:hypothetical protein